MSGYTVSTEAEGFPVTANGYDPTYNNQGDLFLVKFDVNGVRTYGTYVGGTRRREHGDGVRRTGRERGRHRVHHRRHAGARTIPC